MTIMNPKTLVINLLLLLLLQISNFSTTVLSLRAYHKKYYKEEYTVRSNTVTHVVISNELYDLKKGNAGFVCSHGPKIWRQSKPGERYAMIRFKNDGRERHTVTNCHVRSNRGFVNFHISLQPDYSAYCYPSYICKYTIRKDGVHYKPTNKLYRWSQFPSRRISKA